MERGYTRCLNHAALRLQRYLFVSCISVQLLLRLQSSIEKILLVQQTQVPCNRSKTLIADLAVVCSLSG